MIACVLSEIGCAGVGCHRVERDQPTRKCDLLRERLELRLIFFLFSWIVTIQSARERERERERALTFAALSGSVCCASVFGRDPSHLSSPSLSLPLPLFSPLLPLSASLGSAARHSRYKTLCPRVASILVIDSLSLSSGAIGHALLLPPSYIGTGSAASLSRNGIGRGSSHTRTTLVSTACLVTPRYGGVHHVWL